MTLLEVTSKAIDYNVLMYVFYIGAGLAALCLVVAVFLFFILGIPGVIGDLSGRTARKAIESIRNQNENTGYKTYKSSVVNRQRGRVTDEITPSGNLVRNSNDLMGGAMATSKIGANQSDEEYVHVPETSLLTDSGYGETSLLNSDDTNETTLLNYNDTDETTLLGFETSDDTVILDQSMIDSVAEGDSFFEIEYEIVLIHTDEIIA